MAYGVNAAFGLQPRRYLNGAPWNNAVNAYFITDGYATALFTGDPVIPLADGTIGIGVAGGAIRGVFQGCMFTDTSSNIQFLPYWPAAQAILANTTVVAYVADDPNIIFDIQTNSATGYVLANINLNADFAAGTGSTATGQSGFVLDTVTTPPATTATLNLKTLRLTPVPGNTFGLAYNNLEVVINNHDMKGGTGTLGY